MSRQLLPVAFLAAAGCTAALKEPPPMTALAPGEKPARSAAVLLAEGAAEYAKRPDAAAVAKADQLCLEAARVDEQDVAGLLCAIRCKAWLVEHAGSGTDRTELAVAAVQAGQWCQRRAPKDPACGYWLAVALGMQAREKPRTAKDAIGRIVSLLREAAAADPGLDHAGPERILALVLLRAPSWPLGPGDADEALVLARKAVEREPEYPPNQLALGEALARTGNERAARQAYGHAVELAKALSAKGDPDASEWAGEAEAKLKG